MAMQIIEEEPGIGGRFAQGISKSLRGESKNTAVQQFAEAMQQKKQMQKQQLQMEQENETAKKYGLDLTGITDPKTRQMMFSEAIKGNQKSQQFADKIKNNEQIIKGIEKERGLPQGSLDPYKSDPKMAEQISRPSKGTVSERPIDADQLRRIEQVRALPDFDEMDESEQYQEFTRNGVSRENAKSESEIKSSQLKRKDKSFDSAYKAQESFINETTDSYKGFETEMKPRLLQMQNIATNEQLISPSSASFLEALNLPLGMLENPSNELYDKLSQDLLKGLPETYGSRILKVEVENFLKTIPKLINSPDGRRMIASNMLKLGEMKEVYYNEMRRQQKDSLDNRKPLPRDFQQRVFDQVKPQIDRINNDFVKLSNVKAVPEGTVPFFSPSGQIEFVPKKDMEWAEKNGGRRIW